MNKFYSISQKEVFDILKPYTKKSKFLPLLIISIDLTLFLASVVFGLIIDSITGKILLGILQGLTIVFLFVVGHDCCHGSFTSSRKLNSFFGKIAFLPSLHSFSLWELGHNKIHHAYTNLKIEDYTYTPLSPSDYQSLSFIHKLKYRIYRSAWGHGLYYGYEIWFKRMIIPNSINPNLSSSKSNNYSLNDTIILFLYVICYLLFIQFFSIYHNQSFTLNFLLVFLLPFSIWNWLMGFAIYLQHTNPKIKWFDNVEEWDYWESQIDHSPHIKFPRPINFILHNIMEHTAHHSNMNIPLYQLPKAQTTLEKHFGKRISVVEWDFKFYFDSIRKCKLYDYKNHQWVTFKDLNRGDTN